MKLNVYRTSRHIHNRCQVRVRVGGRADDAEAEEGAQDIDFRHALIGYLLSSDLRIVLCRSGVGRAVQHLKIEESLSADSLMVA